MTQIKSILVPTDFSEHAGYALQLARQIALKQKASLQLLHIVEESGSHYMTAMSGGSHDQLDNVYVVKLIEKVKGDLQLVANKLAAEGIKATFKIKIGNPFKQISSHIQSDNHDLIVMGTQGISGVEEIVVGSNTEKVIRHAKCPVITLKAPVELDDVDHIVFAISYFDSEEYFATQLKAIQEMFSAKVHLVTVNTPSNFLTERDMISSLNNFVSNYQISNCSIHSYSDATEEEGIVHFAEDSEADAIAMATHGRTGITHLLTGSLSENLVNHAKLPVITFPLKHRD